MTDRALLRAKHKLSNSRWKAKNRDKYLAHKAVENAIVAGLIARQSCERCGSEKTHAHHDDYRVPLAVRWLCPPHHRARHRELAADGGPIRNIQEPNASLFGGRSHTGKLTRQQVAEILASRAAHKALAEKYGISVDYLQWLRHKAKVAVSL